MAISKKRVSKRSSDTDLRKKAKQKPRHNISTVSASEQAEANSLTKNILDKARVA